MNKPHTANNSVTVISVSQEGGATHLTCVGTPDAHLILRWPTCNASKVSLNNKGCHLVLLFSIGLNNLSERTLKH